MKTWFVKLLTSRAWRHPQSWIWRFPAGALVTLFILVGLPFALLYDLARQRIPDLFGDVCGCLAVLGRGYRAVITNNAWFVWRPE